ncbi:MAG: hypothetical protein HYV19_03065 [Gemmatimonadetes bacterium]|nr:hypothetical protein [Gemmatimonadota bacterium]
MSAPSCPACRTLMEEGFMIDQGDHSTPSQSEWAEGPPERSFWRGLNLKGKERIPAVTYRCPQCGLLQSYAHKV